MKEITKKVISFNSIPTELVEEQWFYDYPSGCFVEVHIEDDSRDALSLWLMDKYIGIEDEDSFFIEMDY